MIVLSLDEVKCKLLVNFPYKTELIDKIKQFPGRVWKKPFWVLPLSQEMVQNVEVAFRPFGSVVKDDKLTNFLKTKSVEQKEVLQWKQEPHGLELIPGTQFHVPPFEHQKTGLSFIQRRLNFALFMEMGTGKTKVILDFLGNMYAGRSMRPTLIVAPVSVINNWQREAMIHQPGLKVVVAQGSQAKKLEALAAVKAGLAQLIVINYESLWRMEKEFSIPWFCMVLDESTRIKHRATQQAKAIIRLGKLAYRKYIMTGTPSPNNPLELFNQIRFLDESVFGSSWYAYRDRYAIMGGYGGYQVLGWKNLPELTKKLASVSYRVLKKDCLDLPEKIYKEYRIPMDPGQSKIYKELAEDLVTSVKGTDIVATVVLAKLTKLRQIACGFVYNPDGQALSLEKNPKLDQLEEILPEIGRNHKVVIWASFREEIAQLGRLCDKLKLPWVKLDGSISAKDRDQVVQDFQTKPHLKVFIGQQHSGGIGITLTAADYCVFFSNDYSHEIRVQAEDRLHRIGQKNQVTYIDLIVKGTLDSTIKRMLQQKANLAESLVPSQIENLVYDDNDI
jgi:SNF2 family DNA or RNA helicase